MGALNACFALFLLSRVGALPVPDSLQVDRRGFTENFKTVTPVTSAFNFAGSTYDEIAQQSPALVRGGSASFELATPMSKTVDDKGLTGITDDFALISADVFKQATGVFSFSSDGFSNAAQLFNINKQLPQIGSYPKLSFSESESLPGKLQPGIATSFEALQQSSVASGQSQSHRESSSDQREAAEKNSDGRETYSTKESFGHENSASHAKGYNQNSETQNSENSRHENGHQIQALSHGTDAQSPAIQRPLSVNDALPAQGSDSAVHNSQTLLASASHDGIAAPTVALPATSITGEKFSNGSKEDYQTNSSNSSAYNIGSNDSKSFAHKESFGDKQTSADGAASEHPSQPKRGRESVRIDGSTSMNKYKETSVVES